MLEFFAFLFLFFSLLLVHLWCVDNALIKGEIEEREYSILPVMSELSTVRYDRVLGLWLQVHGRRVSTVSCRGGAQAGRQLWHPLLDRGRKRRRKSGFFGLRHKTKEADGG